MFVDMSFLLISNQLKYTGYFSGSGSSYLYGFFDQAWKEGMTREEAEVCIFEV